MIDLNKGDNPVLIKLCHGHEAWRLYFRLADAHDIPLTDGVTLRGPNGNHRRFSTVIP